MSDEKVKSCWEAGGSANRALMKAAMETNGSVWKRQLAARLTSDFQQVPAASHSSALASETTHWDACLARM
ncbi:uncharacterized protein SPSK_08225 [Sporothrix schenckii 1099-18]|uniref:Uncharacterized protein n=1 Tax=Sporothrix schenckii 1099-18 TaxID=1397361 RepID=A0A0F2MGN5_SPOSC|nr:uncharacterized protein SPSK_08225 [Sporothrix schenckii 1099-18]KJR87990.1 hypothetical protein SPSK_08225 [Sporothrix schenckii 1099-18]